MDLTPKQNPPVWAMALAAAFVAIYNAVAALGLPWQACVVIALVLIGLGKACQKWATVPR